MTDPQRDAGRTRVVVVGATGNIGTSVVAALSAAPEVGSVLGLARRRPGWTLSKVEWATADVLHDDLVERFSGADVVIHLAWLFQPTHDPVTTWRTNVEGSIRVFDAAARAGASALVYGSSVGAYSPKEGNEPVGESWPTHGWPDAAYTREKAYLERVLDRVERQRPAMRVVRMRPAFVFKRESACEQRRLFAGPLLPHRLVRGDLVPFVPDLTGLRFQAVHSGDVADAYRRAVLLDVRGAFNIAADPVVDAAKLAELLGTRAVRVPAGPVRSALNAAWRLHLVPASPHLFDAVRRLPLMDTGRAREKLGWSPSVSATAAIEEFLQGLRQASSMDTPPLARHAEGTGRLHELRTRIGARQ